MTFVTRRSCAAVLAVVGLSVVLSACAPLIVAGVAVGALVATDRRSSGTQLEDQNIELRASGRVGESLGDRVHVNVTSYNRQVLITGEVPTAQDRQLVEQIVTRVDNVRAIFNELGVMGNTTLTQRSSDSFITSKVKASMVDAKDLYSSAFKVVTERGTVYMMGVVTQREAARATEIARSTGDVKKVVRLFEIISEEELQRTLPQTAPAPTTGTPPPPPPKT